MSAAQISRKWRVVDIVVASIIAVASGLIFWFWNFIYGVPYSILSAITPGFDGFINGLWLFAGPLAAVIVRKPGAALYAETVAAAVELVLGNTWGVGALMSGLVQGLGAEIALMLFVWKVYNLPVIMLSGSLAGLACGIRDWISNPGWGMAQGVIYNIASILSGLLVAGIVVWLIYLALAKTGVLSRFAAGHTQEAI